MVVVMAEDVEVVDTEEAEVVAVEDMVVMIVMVVAIDSVVVIMIVENMILLQTRVSVNLNGAQLNCQHLKRTFIKSIQM